MGSVNIPLAMLDDQPETASQKTLQGGSDLETTEFLLYDHLQIVETNRNPEFQFSCMGNMLNSLPL